MATRTKLTKEQLSELTLLVDSAKAPVGEDLEYTKRAVVGILDDNIYKKNGTYCVPFGIPNNPELVKWVENYTGIEGKYINSLHTVEYTVGSSTGIHYDVNGPKTFIILLKKPEEGGEFIYGDDLLDLDEGEVLHMNGAKIGHGVKEILKGSRRVFVIWISPKERGALI